MKDKLEERDPELLKREPIFTNEFFTVENEDDKIVNAEQDFNQNKNTIDTDSSGGDEKNEDVILPQKSKLVAEISKTDSSTLTKNELKSVASELFDIGLYYGY